MAYITDLEEKYSPKIDPYLSPIYKESIDLGILEYLKSRNFERISVQYGIMSGARAKLIAESNQENYADFLNSLQTGYTPPQHRFIVLFLADFINWLNYKVDLDNIIQDVKNLRVEIEARQKFRIAYEKYQKESVDFEIQRTERPIFPTKKLSLETEKKGEVKEKLFDGFGDLKIKWKKTIADGNIKVVVDEIIDYGVEDDNDIIALSSRWHSLKTKYHQGVTKEDDFIIENNKIVHALLNFIKNLKDTEG